MADINVEIAETKTKIAEAEAEVKRIKDDKPPEDAADKLWERWKWQFDQASKHLSQLQDEKVALINQRQGN